MTRRKSSLEETVDHPPELKNHDCNLKPIQGKWQGKEAFVLEDWLIYLTGKEH